MTIKRIFACVVFLMGAAFAQKAPLTLTISSGHLTAANTSSQEVIAFVVSYDSTTEVSDILNHDWYFKTHGIAPAEIRELNADLPEETGGITKAKLLWAQTADGTTWGDASKAKSILDARGPMKEFYKSLAASYNQGEESFLARLKTEAVFRGHAQHLLQVQKQSGTEAAVSMVNERILAAESRRF